MLRTEIRDINELVLTGDVFSIDTKEDDSLVPLRLPELVKK